MLDLSNYFNNGYELKMEHYVLVDSRGNELVIQVDHRQNQTWSGSLLEQLKRKKDEHNEV